ncbi:haloacid dehalogenase, partial [Candidatus Saccharibacteria bacterium]
PEPAIFAIVLERLGVTADECVFVDDNPRHIAGATAAGIHGILFSSTEQLKQALAKNVN